MGDRGCIFPPASAPAPKRGSKRASARSRRPATIAARPDSSRAAQEETPSSSFEQDSTPALTEEWSPISCPAGLISSPTSSQPDEEINMSHVELLLHFSLGLIVPNMEKSLQEQGTRVTLKAGVDAPYLLHEVLALSARHLSHVKEDGARYLEDATRLQTKAIALFNAQRAHVDSSTCVPMVLFADILGRHLFIDALANRSSDLTTFLDSYVDFVRIHRGVKVIIERAWPLLQDSELSPILAWGIGLNRFRGQGQECDGILKLLSVSKNLSAAAARSCHRAVELVQIAIDDVGVQTYTKAKYLCQVIFNWSLLVSEDFAELLAERTPEALAVFAYYAVLLHLASDLWQVGDAGPYVFGLISRHLGADWDEWLKWPRDVIEGNSMSSVRMKMRIGHD
ncbi:hypothetical protein K4K58_009543 [Colletotrichum sp. SAR11_239]|nr:hypothetical protein K4K58_009543 [Colletotrichum sp. SAR11_239]